MSIFSISLFGPFRISHADSFIDTITSPKIQALLAYLALEPSTVHRREALAELLWPERPPGVARQNLRQSLTRLNRALDGAVSDAKLLTVTRQTVQFNHQAAQVDVFQFIELLEHCQNHSHEALVHCFPCCQKLSAAVDLYRSDFLSTLITDSPAFDEWTALKREWLHRQMWEALNTLVAHHTLQKEYGIAYQYAWGQTELDPLREEGHRQVMQTLAVAGRSGEVRAHYERCRRILHDELGVEPSVATTALWEEIKRGRVAELQGSKHENNAPMQPRQPATLRSFPLQHTPFIGREGELTAVGDLLSNPDCHLLTLLGYGGVGKTRLALQVAQEKAGEFADGAAFVGLASVAAAEYVPGAMADALGLVFSKKARSIEEQRAELLTSLHGKSFLFVVDNIEHLLAEQSHADLLLSLVGDMLQAAPKSKILTTSRQPLHLRAEWLFDVEGLNFPASDSGLPDAGFAFEQFGATALFVQSAQRIRSNFLPFNDDAIAVAQICRLVEGSPLALELAAGWARQMDCIEIHQHVVQSLDFLSTTMRDVPSRHRSIRAVFESTWSQLPDDLQQICAKLALFRGAFSTEAAGAVASADLHTLVALRDRSLLRLSATFSGEERYEMHELLRQYAYEKLGSNADQLAISQRAYGRFFMQMVENHIEGLSGVNMAASVAALHEQIANIRTAWQWAIVAGSIEPLSQAAHGLLRYFAMSNQMEEAISIFGDAINALQQMPVAQAGATLAELLSVRSRAFYRAARYPEAIDHAQEAYLLATEQNATHAAASATLYWGISLLNQGKYDEARDKLLECLTLTRSEGHLKLESDSLRALGILTNQTDDLEQAEVYYKESLVIGHQLDDARGISACLGNLGSIRRHQGDFVGAQRYLAESMEMHKLLGDRSSEARTLSMLGELAADLEEYKEAEEHFVQAFELLTEINEHHYAADALVGLGEAYARQGRVPEAIPLWEQALARYEEAGEASMAQQVQQYMAQLGDDGTMPTLKLRI